MLSVRIKAHSHKLFFGFGQDSRAITINTIKSKQPSFTSVMSLEKKWMKMQRNTLGCFVFSELHDASHQIVSGIKYYI